MDGFKLFFETEATPEDVRNRVIQMFLQGNTKKEIGRVTLLHPVTIRKILEPIESSREVIIPVRKPNQKLTPEKILDVKNLDSQGKSAYEIHNTTGLDHRQILKILGKTSSGGKPRSLTDDQKARIVYGATKLFYNDSELARLLGVKNRVNITRIVKPYLTPEIIEKRKERSSQLGRTITPADKSGIKFDDIPAIPNYQEAEKYAHEPEGTITTQIVPRDRTEITGPNIKSSPIADKNFQAFVAARDKKKSFIPGIK